MPLPEAFIQKKIIERFEYEGYYVIKLMKTNKNGIPDLMMLKRGEPPVFIEVKRMDGRSSAVQRFRHAELMRAGCKVIIAKDWRGIVIPEEEFLEVYVPGKIDPENNNKKVEFNQEENE